VPAPAEPNISNRILLSFPSDSLRRLQPYLERISLVQRRILHSADASVEYLYFIDHGIVSLLKTMQDGRTVEIAAIGAEGAIGTFALYGIQPPIWDAIVQIPGNAHRIALSKLLDEMQRSAFIHRIFQRYMHALISEITQIAACNRLHSLEERCCRWLLLVRDRIQSDTFPVTHEFLALLLGVQRAGLSITAGMLQRAGFIRYSRGWITILDSAGLEATACECYLSIRSRLRRSPGK